MNYYNRISKAFEGANRLPLNDNSKYVLFSDCHRGTGRANDNFLKNEYIYLAALKYYYAANFTYLELGDGDELWENRSFNDIKNMHTEVFDMLSKYFFDNRFYAVYGNHDIVKKSSGFLEKHFQTYYCYYSMCMRPLFPQINFYPSIILEDSHGTNDIYLTHGHQADIINSTFWRVSCFLVRYLWKPLEHLGIPDPTSAAQNNTKQNAIEKRLANWAKDNHHILITGHTHRPVVGTYDSQYYNIGSCVSPAGITCIEIERKSITLVKWTLRTNDERSLYVIRKVLGDN